ncbi:MAG: 2,4-dihydroxyhept-2-ene-1,7-dioic acid aldolase [Spirochaetae bacterium HGW-Spirochaetae-7]|nr:MAG: 2,4-dihydroxyhept-2-ene-1,7-dioic acid aldolase [Spirochaetae bacterium HGW-Spirochaetae-7]
MMHQVRETPEKGADGMNYMNHTKAIARDGGTSFGIFQTVASAAVSEILANRGFDWILVDMEHGMAGIETAGDLFAAIDRGGPTPLVRVPSNDQATIKRALDAGAMGVMIPMVNTREDAVRAVSSCKYAPAGTRGIGPGRVSLFGIRMGEYLATADAQVMVIPQAEHREAVEHIDEILSVPGIDVIFVGPYDLSCSMGLPGQVSHPDVEKAIETVLSAARRAGVTPGIFCMDVEGARHRAAQGFRFIAIGLESVFLDRAVKGALGLLRGDERASGRNA